MEESIQQVEKELEEYFAELFQDYNNSNSTETTDKQQHTLNLDEVTDHIQRILTTRGEVTTNQLQFALEKSRILMKKNLEQALIHYKYRQEKCTPNAIKGCGGGMSPSKGLTSSKK